MLLERADALALLRAGFERVHASGCGEVVTVCGEAGIGKTSLVREFTRAIAGHVPRPRSAATVSAPASRHRPH